MVVGRELGRTEAAMEVLAQRLPVAPDRAAGPEPVLPHVPPGTPGDPLSPLTARERQIAWIAGQGSKTSTIARLLRVSPRTIDVHLSRIYRKLAVPGRAGLVAIVARMEPTAPRPEPASAALSGSDAGVVAHGHPEHLGQQIGESTA
jgi:DNA-binding CsgD family transcriptional regulator